MISEKSCGAVVFTRKSGSIEYVIVRSKEGTYGFPKGHVEGMETEFETALREIGEETGLEVSFVDGFRTEDSYVFDRNGVLFMKNVVYFLAEYADLLPVAQETELSSIHLMCFEDAIALFQFDGLRRILTEAHAFLTQH